MHRAIIVAATFAVLAVRGPAPAAALEIGSAAPPFDLAALSGEKAPPSRSLFAAHRHVFLVFWSAGCPHCVEALRAAEEFHRRYGGPDVAVAGINADEGDLLAIRGMIEMNAISFPQLRDPGGVVSAAYGVPFETLTIVHVVGGGVAGERRDPQGDLGLLMEEMLLEDAATVVGEAVSRRGDGASTGKEPAASAPSAGDGAPRFSIHARERLRVAIVDTRSAKAVGLYGEAVSPGRTALGRIEAEVSASLTENLRAGGLLRISNEDERVLETGPAYYGSQWGSAFAEISTRGFSLRLGYYSLHMTPLTLMRWDWEDNPRLGGSAGCGCGPAAGSILFESLEVLGPDFTFEGALATFSGSGFEARLFYAMPRRPLETDYMAYRSAAAPRARYSLEIAGGEARWQRFDHRTGSFWKLSARALSTFENSGSVDFLALHYAAADPWTEQWLAGFSAEIPLLRWMRLRGEIVPWSENVLNGIVDEGGRTSLKTSGAAGIGGLVIEPGPRHLLRVDYLRLNPRYDSPFAALSYVPNREGVRISAREWIVPERLALSLFYEGLREIELPLFRGSSDRKRFPRYGVSIDAAGPSGWGGGAGWLDESYWGGGDAPFSYYGARRRAIAAYVSRSFGKYGVLQAQYQRVGTGTSILDDPYADIWSLDATIGF